MMHPLFLRSILLHVFHITLCNAQTTYYACTADSQCTSATGYCAGYVVCSFNKCYSYTNRYCSPCNAANREVWDGSSCLSSIPIGYSNGLNGQRPQGLLFQCWTPYYCVNGNYAKGLVGYMYPNGVETRCPIGTGSGSNAFAPTDPGFCTACTNIPTNGHNVDPPNEYNLCNWACNIGYYSTGAACVPCPRGFYCKALSISATECPGNRTSPALSSSMTNCTCSPGSAQAASSDVMILLVDTTDNAVYTVTTSGVSTLLAGVPGSAGFIDGEVAKFSSPGKISVSSDFSTAIVSDQPIETRSSVLRSIDIQTGVTSTFAGHAYTVVDYSSANLNIDGNGTAATLYAIINTQFVSGGSTLYAYSAAMSLVRSISYPQAIVSTIIGDANSAWGMTDGVLGSGGLLYPGPTQLSPDGSYLLFTSKDYCNVRKLALATNQISTVAGSTSKVQAVMYCGCVDGIGTAATFKQPWHFVFSPDGQAVYIIDLGNHGIRRMDTRTFAVTFLTGSCDTTVYGLDGVGAAVSVDFSDIAITSDGLFLFAAGYGSPSIRKIVISTATVTTITAASVPYGVYFYLSLYTASICTPCASGEFSLQGAACSKCLVGFYCSPSTPPTPCASGACI
jgi:hypothetical protein